MSKNFWARANFSRTNVKNDSFSENTSIESVNDSDTLSSLKESQTIDETTFNSDKVTNEKIDSNLNGKDYEDLRDKSLEEIQNELIKLLDEMTRKYHNGSTVLT